MHASPPPPTPPTAGREDINSGAKDAHELYARDRLRRNVQWMSGVEPLAPPTLSEMDKLLEKVRARSPPRRPPLFFCFFF